MLASSLLANEHSPGSVRIRWLICERKCRNIDNGARLGWLIDSVEKRVHVYRSGQPVDVLDDPVSVSGNPILPGFVLNVRELW